MIKDELSCTFYRTTEAPKAAVFIVHGMEEHQRRYRSFAEYLNSCGIAVMTYDLPGHGETSSLADRGWFGEKNGWKNLTESAFEAARKTAAAFPGVPLVYFGHSMGTMIGRTFLQTYDGLVDAMILSGAPAYQSAAVAGKAVARTVRARKGKRGHSALLDNLATGAFNKAIDNPRTALDWLSYNEENVDRYIADPDCGFPFTVQGYIDLFDGMIRMHDVSKYRCTNPSLPLLLFAGAEDPCIGGKEGFEDTVETLRKAGYVNIDTRLYPSMRHETLNEKDAQRVFADTADWILSHIGSDTK